MRRSALLALLVFSLPLFFLTGPGRESRVFNELWNLGHVFFYMVVTMLLNDFLRQRLSNQVYRYALIFTVASLFGVVVECVQEFVPGRYSSGTDVLRNAAGIIISLLILIIKGQKSKKVGILSVTGAAIIILFIAFPIVRTVGDEWQSHKKFPVLGSFESNSEITRWQSNNSEIRISGKVARKGDSSMEILLTGAQYSGVSFVYFPSNWQRYETLKFSVFVESGELTLHYRVHDELHGRNQEYHNRFNGKVLLGHGWNDVRIPLRDIEKGPTGRAMDMSRIRGVGFFVMNLSDNQSIFIDDVGLE